MSSSITAHREYRRIVYMICVIAALGGLLFGIDQGFIANSLQTIESVYHLSDGQGETYAAILAAGGIVGAILSGVFARILGRKKVIVIAGFLFTSMSLISAFLPPFGILHACRFGLGFAVGLASFTVPLYLSETAPTAIRGAMTTLFQLMITIGILLIAVTNVVIAKWLGHTGISLSMMFMVIVIFASVMFIGALFLPESPRWLILKGKKEQALKALQRIRNTEVEVQNEIREIEESALTNKGSGFAMLSKGFFWKVLLLGIGLQMFQQLVGINMMIYYAPTFFGYASITGVFAMLAIYIVNVLSTFPAIRWIEKWGRKRLLYVGALVMMIAMLASGFAFMAISSNPDNTLAKAILVISAVVYIFGFACSWGPVVWVMCSEVFPLKGREIGMTVTTIVNWTFAGLVINYSLSFMKAYGNHSIFFLFAGFCVLAMVFLKLFVPETKDISLEKIEQNLESGVKLNKIGK